jgi:broad specificity phosphatase PhoE
MTTPPVPVTRVFLLRHAESADPTVFHGAESDTDLSARGYRQAEAIARTLVPDRPELVISSAMRRARLTAAAIARVCVVPHREEPLLHERRVGVLSGKPFDYEGIWAETARRWTAGETSYAHSGAESFDEIRRRVLPVWERLVGEHAGRRLAIVAHGVVCKVIVISLFPRYDWTSVGPVRNASVTELVHDGRQWQLPRLDWLPPSFREEEFA